MARSSSAASPRRRGLRPKDRIEGLEGRIQEGLAALGGRRGLGRDDARQCVFGLKPLWHQSPAMIAKLRAAMADPRAGSRADPGADSGRELPDTVHELFSAKIGEPKYIRLRRHNKLAQAVSYYKGGA